MMYLRTEREIQDNLKILFPRIRDVWIEEDVRKLTATVHVKLPWWMWLGFGIIHYVYRKKIEIAFGSYGAAGVRYVIMVS